MKKSICVEWKHFSSCQYLKKVDNFIGFVYSLSGRSNKDKLYEKPWVAEIIGFDSVFKYKRKFLNGQIDFSDSSKNGKNGVKLYFIVEENKIYQLKNPTLKKNESYFFLVSGGEKIILEEEEVIECLRKNLA